MGRRGLLALVVVAAVVAAGCAEEPVPTPVVGGNALQPLTDGMSWIYRASGDLVSDERTPIVFSVVGREQIDGETAWLIAQNIGQPYATRTVAVTRNAEVWTVALDELANGRWSRAELDRPQLTQPPPGERRWTN